MPLTLIVQVISAIRIQEHAIGIILWLCQKMWEAGAGPCDLVVGKC